MVLICRSGNITDGVHLQLLGEGAPSPTSLLDNL